MQKLSNIFARGIKHFVTYAGKLLFAISWIQLYEPESGTSGLFIEERRFEIVVKKCPCYAENMKKEMVNIHMSNIDAQYKARLATILNAIEGQVVSSETRAVIEQAKRDQLSPTEMRKLVANSIRSRYVQKT